MDRVQLHIEDGVYRQRAWRNAATASSRVVRVSFGRLGEGRWWAERSDDKGGAYVFRGRQAKTLALRLAYSWMRDSGQRWWPTPAAFDALGDPIDGLPWVRRGGEWFLEP